MSVYTPEQAMEVYLQCGIQNRPTPSLLIDFAGVKLPATMEELMQQRQKAKPFSGFRFPGLEPILGVMTDMTDAEFELFSQVADVINSEAQANPTMTPRQYEHLVDVIFNPLQHALAVATRAYIYQEAPERDGNTEPMCSEEDDIAMDMANIKV